MNPTTILYISQGIHGLAYGMLLFLLASGLTMIFGMMGRLGDQFRDGGCSDIPGNVTCEFLRGHAEIGEFGRNMIARVVA